jgi:hypothetical protein
VKYTNLSFPLQGSKFSVVTHISISVKYFTSEYFIDGYRTMEGKLVVKIPDWLTLELKEFNLDGFDISKEETKDGDTRIIKTLFLKLIKTIVLDLHIFIHTYNLLQNTIQLKIKNTHFLMM